MTFEKGTSGRETDLGLLINHICRRPAMYTGRDKLNEVALFIEGFCYASETFSVEIREFNYWLSSELDFPRNWAWWDGLELKYPDSEKAFRELPELFETFRLSRK